MKRFMTDIESLADSVGRSPGENPFDTIKMVIALLRRVEDVAKVNGWVPTPNPDDDPITFLEHVLHEGHRGHQ